MYAGMKYLFLTLQPRFFKGYLKVVKKKQENFR